MSTENSGYIFRMNTVTMSSGFILSPTRLTVVIGPNNVGKSKLLKEICSILTANPRVCGVVVNDVDVNVPDSLDSLLGSYGVERQRDEKNCWGFYRLDPDLVNGAENISSMQPEEYRQAYAGGQKLVDEFYREYCPSMVAYLSTENRLRMLEECDGMRHRLQVYKLLHVLYHAGVEAEKVVSRLVREAFGKEVKLDFTVPLRLKLRVGESFEGIPEDPREALLPMQKFETLDDQGDGIKSYLGVAVPLAILERSLYLIDEPEAFLHPPQAFRLGSVIAKYSTQERQIIVSTHSSDILRGIVRHSSDVQIVRMDRGRGKNSFTLLDPSRLGEISNDPLLTSARVLEGLFYSTAIVVEAEADARFYHAAFAKQYPGVDIHFVNADNKQTVSKILRLYKEFGVKAAGIVDIDFVNNQQEMRDALEKLGVQSAHLERAVELQVVISRTIRDVPIEERWSRSLEKLGDAFDTMKAVDDLRSESESDVYHEKAVILKSLGKRLREISDGVKPWDILKKGGREQLPVEARSAFDELALLCSDYGLFVNPAGELESVLSEYGQPHTSNKKKWIRTALKLIPEITPSNEKYPWKLLKRIHDHFDV